MSTYGLGLIGQQHAVKYLKTRGYEILIQNYKIWGGELDIIAFQKIIDELVFIEVKTRITNWLNLDETFSRRKSMKMKKAIGVYLMQTHQEDTNWRIDHIGIKLSPANELICLEHFVNVD